MTKLSTSLILATLLTSTAAFTAPCISAPSRHCALYMSEESVFVADVVEEKKDGEDDSFDAVEKMGRGAAKVSTYQLELEPKSSFLLGELVVV